MINSVKDFLDMAAAEYQFLLTDGAALAKAVPRIASGRTELGRLLALATAYVDTQDAGTGTLTENRAGLKAATLPATQVLRRWVLLAAATPPATRQALLPMPKEAAKGPDKAYLDYLAALLGAAPGITKKEREDMGYNETVTAGLQTQFDTLRTTAGATRQQQGKQKTAGTLLAPVVADVRTWLDTELTPLVQGQALTPGLEALVARYDVLHVIKHTAGTRRPKALTGHTHFGHPEVVVRRRLVNIPGGTLRNKSGRGVSLCYYLTDTPDVVPTDGRGRVVRYREIVEVADFGVLGPDANAPFLMVNQVNEGGEGTYRVEYSPTGG